MNNDKLLLILIILVGFGVLIDFVTALGLAMLSYEVKPLISKVESKMDSLEMPDFPSLNLMAGKMEYLLLKVDKLPWDKVDDFIVVWDRLDEVDGTDLIVDILPLFKEFLLKELVK